MQNREPEDSTRALVDTRQMARDIGMSGQMPSPQAQEYILNRACRDSWTGRGVPGPDAFLWSY